MTRLQAIIAKAGVTPQAAHVWQKAAEIEEAVVATYIEQATRATQDITVAGLLAWAHGDGGGGEGHVGGDDDDPPTHACQACGLIHVVRRDGGGE